MRTLIITSIPKLRPCQSYVLNLTSHLCLGTLAERLDDLLRPFKRNDIKSLLSSSISFESVVITCELEGWAHERRAQTDRATRHERRPIEGRGCLSFSIRRFDVSCEASARKVTFRN